MAKKRGLAANRGLDALLGSIKKEKAITAPALYDDRVADAEPNPIEAKNGHAKIIASTKVANKLPVDKASATDEIRVDNNQSGNQSSDDEMCLVQIKLEQLQAGRYQPRRDMSEAALTELASSIRQHGVMQPIVIRPLLASEDKVAASVTHEIIAGERRWRAARMAGEITIPAIERVLSDELAIALALIENIQREDLSVIEQAEALQRFHTEFGMSHAMIADVVGKARTTVSNLLRLNHLHDTVKTHLADGVLDMGHARALLSLSLEQQPIIARKIIDGTMTVREAERLVKSILNPHKATGKADSKLAFEIDKLSQKLSESVGAKVKLKQKKGGKGSVEIFFHSEEELSTLIEQLQRS